MDSIPGSGWLHFWYCFLHMVDNRSNVLEIIRLGIAKENDVSCMRRKVAVPVRCLIQDKVRIVVPGLRMRYSTAFQFG